MGTKQRHGGGGHFGAKKAVCLLLPACDRQRGILEQRASPSFPRRCFAFAIVVDNPGFRKHHGLYHPPTHSHILFELRIARTDSFTCPSNAADDLYHSLAPLTDKRDPTITRTTNKAHRNRNHLYKNVHKNAHRQRRNPPTPPRPPPPLRR